MRILILILLLGCFVQLQANTYYFSTISGNDSRSATEAQNPATPWQSIAKLNAVISMLNAGDIILFKRNEVFDGSITINRSGSLSQPLTFGAFGTGVKPIINGFSTLTNFTPLTSGIWEASVPADTMVNTLVLNGVHQVVGRFPNSNTPNKGYLNFESVSGNTSITDNELTSATNWTGGDIIIRKTRWVIDRNLITSHSGNTIYYNSESGYNPDNNFGYFIQNHPKTLDLPGEWYYKANEKKIGIYLPTGNPASSKIQASVVKTLVSINNQSNIAFENLSFQGPNSAAFEIVNAQHIRISNCDIYFDGINAVNARGCSDITIEGADINYTNNVALNLEGCSYVTVKNNKIQNTGVNPGMGRGDSGSYEAIMVSGDNVLIDHNTVENTGYIAITFRGSSNTISNNFIKNFASVKDDAAGIYSWNNIPNGPTTSNLKITDNIILNGLGAPEGTIWTDYRPASGIYMDDNVGNIEMTGNTAANCGLYGAYIHNSYNINLQNNTFYNNHSQIVLRTDEHGRQSPVRNVNMMNNVFVSKEFYHRVAEFGTYQDDVAQFGNFDNNYYARPVDDNVTIFTSHFQNGSYPESGLTLDQWKALYGKDANSQKSPATVASTDLIRFEYNSTTSSVTIPLQGEYVDIRNQAYNGSITLAPFTSVILLPKSGVTVPGADCPGTGTIFREQWSNINGNDISTIPVTTTPSSKNTLTSLESSNVGDNYGDRIRGYLCPPKTGDYTFMISGDDQAELWLSTDNNPANKRKIASLLLWTNFREFTKYPSQKSAPIILQEGQLYYIEVLHKEGDVGDHVTVGWQMPNGGTQVPIPGDRLAPYDNGPITPPVTSNGLNYKYYEGNWDILPNFNTLTPVKTGTTPNIDLCIKNVNEYFGVVWEGYINIPAAGNYTFETISDDGSKFYFNSLYSPTTTALVNNDGVHAQQSATGTVYIPAAGAYPVSITFFEKYGGESMQLFWSGPGIIRQLVPDAAFKQGTVVNPTDPAGCSATGTILHEVWQNVGGNDIASINQNASPTVVNQITILETSNLGDNYGERIRGYICPPVTGDYRFTVAGDDAVQIWLSTDDNPLNKVNIVNLLSWTDFREWSKFPSQQSALISLQAGRKYYIEVLHKESAGGDHVSIAWQLPGGAVEAPIPGTRLFPFVTGTTPPSQDCAGVGSILRERWDNVSGNQVSRIPVATPPSATNQVNVFESSNIGNTYGERLRGYICPPLTGDYIFMISGDDHVALWLSTDENPGNKAMVAVLNDWSDFHQFTKYPSQRSVAIRLTAGYKYYVEVLHKQNQGADHVSVAWQLPNGTTEIPIAGSHLVPFNTGSSLLATGANSLRNSQAVEASNEVSLQLKATPNPFRTTATIQLYPIESGDATVEIYNVQGVLLQRMFSGKVQAGITKTLKLSSDGLSPGVYIIHLVTKTKVVSQRVIFMR